MASLSSSSLQLLTIYSLVSQSSPVNMFFSHLNQPSHMMTGHTVSGLASVNNTATQDRKTLQQNNSLRGSTANRVSSPGPRNASTTRNNNNKRTANTNKSSTNKVGSLWCLLWAYRQQLWHSSSYQSVYILCQLVSQSAIHISFLSGFKCWNKQFCHTYRQYR